MATVSHYAMRRYPVGHVDGQIQLGTNQYYVAQNQQIAPMYDKSKKTWSQRLKITKAEKNSPPQQQHPITIQELPDYSPSALSRSMKYAEPWLYGTVRGIPARPVHGQAIFTPIPAEVAVVVCSCPEYLNGTKKEMKKASICKKCKGSRLPLAPIGGTVRIRSTTAPIIHKPRGSAGTVRLPQSSSIKSRPTILDPQNDPYDLMRRTRLLSPEPTKPSKIVDKTLLRNRAKSTSPTRGRSRNRLIGNNSGGGVSNSAQLSQTTDQDQLSAINNRSRSASRSKQDHWLDTFDIDRGGRRSILRCDVNPYDLISSHNHNKHNNEFSPNHDDDHHNNLMFEANLRRSDPTGKSSMKLNYTNVKAIAGQRISLGEKTSSSSLITQNGENFIYDNIAVTTVNNNNNNNNSSSNNNSNSNNNNNSCNEQEDCNDGTGLKKIIKHDVKQKHQKGTNKQEQLQQTMIKAQSQQQRNSVPKQSQQQEHHHHNSQKTSSHLVDNLGQHEVKPKRPPRRKHETSSADDEDNEMPETISTKLLSNLPQSAVSSSGTSLTNMKNEYQLTHGALSYISTELVTSQKLNGIKSILKRPSSVTSSMSSSSDIDTKYNNLNNNNINNDLRGDNTNTGNNNINNNIDGNHSGDLKSCNDRIVGSNAQFYLPLPQTIRKKVQFMVEDRIIHDEHENEELLNKSLTKFDNKFNVNDDKRNHHHTNDSYLLEQQRKQQEILDLLQQQQQQKQQQQQHKNENKPYQNQDLEENHSHTQQSSKQHKFYGHHTTNDDFNKTLIKDTTLKETIPKISMNQMLKFNEESSTQVTKSNVLDSNTGVVIVNANNNKQNNIIRYSNQNTIKGNNSNHIDKSTDNPDISYSNSTEQNLDSDNPLSNPITVRKPSALRRTHSDRRSNTTTLNLNFNDTMALRIKNNRVDSRDIFSNDGHEQSSSLAKIQKPSVLLSLPLSPLSSTNNNNNNALTKTQVVQVTDDDNNLPEKGLDVKHLKRQPQPPRPPRQTTNKKISWQEEEHNEIVMIKNEPNNPSLENDDRNLQDVDNNTKLDNKENSSNHEQNECDLYEVYYSFGTSSVSTIDSSDSGCSTTLSNNINNIKDDDNMEKKLSVLSKHSPKQQIKHFNHQIQSIYHEQHQAKPKNDKDKNYLAQKEIFNGTRLFGNQNIKINNNNKPQSQKTVVRVAPFNKQSSEIHRLKIKHEDVNQFDRISQKKTSILINGDDCYSTVNVNNDTPIYQSSVVVTDGTKINKLISDSLKITSNTVTINVSSPTRTPEEELIYKNNKINTLLNLNTTKSVIPIGGGGCGIGDNDNHNINNNCKNIVLDEENTIKRGRTLIQLDYDKKIDEKQLKNDEIISHEEELVKILRNPVEAVRRNLVPHVCGKNITKISDENVISKNQRNDDGETIKHDRCSFIGKLLEDPILGQLAEGLDNDVVAKLIENSLKRLKENRTNVDTSGTKDNDDMTKLIDISLEKIKEERLRLETNKNQKSSTTTIGEDQTIDDEINRESVSSTNSFTSANYELFDFDNQNESDCYQSCSSELTGDDDTNSTRSKFYQMLVDATLSEIEISTTIDDDHHYESIRLNGDPIYEEISEVPPPLPLSPPPLNDPDLEKKNTRSMFEGASKYDILSYLVDAKERGIVREETYEYNFSNTSDVIIEEEIDTLSDLNTHKMKPISDISSRISHLSIASDSSEDTSLTSSLINNTDTISNKINLQCKSTSDIERNDSGVGSETSKSSRSKYQNQNPQGSLLNKNSPIHLCEDCDGPVETQITDSGVMFAPLVCRKCGKKRAERKEIITEIVETEEKYGRDLQIVLEEFCQPMLVAGLLTQEQLSAIFLNTEELLENNQTLAERMRDALDIAMEQGDDDLLTVNVGKIFLEATPMLHAFESYCVRQAAASLLLANLEKEKELLRIFLRVSQMENTVLRRMNLNSFLMVPVQRVTKYPLLLARLYKVTPLHLDGRELLKQAQEKIELHLNHMNQEAKDVPTKLWRRISSSSPNRRSSCEIDMINIKLRKMAIDVLEWNHDEVRFALEGKLLFTQPTDSNWKKGRTIKLTPVNALLVTNGKPSVNYKAEKALSDQLNFPKHTGIREASLLLVKEKGGRYTLIREPLYLDRCVVCTEADWDDYLEVHEISSKDTFIFKAEDGVRTKQWYTQLQYHAQGMGAWRKRRNALANIMINGMLSRT